MPKYEYKSDKNEIIKKSKNKSAIGQGKIMAKDQAEEANRKAVLQSVTQTILGNMKEANDTSKQDADKTEKELQDIQKTYNDDLENIRNVELSRSKVEEEIIKNQNLKKETKKYEKAYKRLNRAKKAEEEKTKEVSDYDKMQELGTKLSADPNDEALDKEIKLAQEEVNKNKGVFHSGKRKEAEKKLGGLKAQKDERTSDRASLGAYQQKYGQNISEEQMKAKKKELKKAQRQTGRAQKDFDLYDKADVRISDLQQQLQVLQEKKVELYQKIYETIVNGNQKWNEIASAHRIVSKNCSSAYDQAAMQYYVIKRNQIQLGATADYKLEIPDDVKKNIVEYRGRVDTSQVSSKLNELKMNPDQVQTFDIVADGDVKQGSMNVMSGTRKFHKGIATTYKDTSGEEKETKLSNSYEEREQAPGTAPHELTVNAKDESGYYLNTADTLEVQKLVTNKGRLGNRKSVQGVVINGEFVAADKNLYKSTEDAGFGYKSKVQGKKGGDFALEQEIVQAMMSSRYFQHIYAENIEQYINYPADNRALVELIEPSKKPKTQAQQQQTPPPQTQQPPAFYALKGTTEEERRKEFKGLDDDLKIQVMYKEASSVKDPVNVYTTYLNYLGIIDRKKMRAKLIGVLLQTENADNIRDAKELARQSGITELVVAANNTADVNNTALVAACDHYTQKTIDGWRFSDLQEFFVGDGARAAKGTSFEGMIKYDTMHTIGEQTLAALNLASGNQKELMDIEKKLETAKEGTEHYKSLEGQKEALEKKIEGGKIGQFLGLFKSVLDFLGQCKRLYDKIVETIDKVQGGDEGPKELYKTWVDELFDWVGIVIDMIGTLYEIVTFGAKMGLKIKTSDPFEKAYDTIQGTYSIITNSYYLVQNSRKVHAISTAQNTMQTTHKAAIEENAQVMRLLDSTRRNTGKAISDNSRSIVTGALDIGSAFADPQTSAILGIVSSAIDVVGSWITNKVYNWKEEKAAFKYAFGDKADRYYGYSGFDRVLRDVTGIKSRKHLAPLTRIFSAIDTHVLIREAPEDSPAFKMAATGMGALFAKNDNAPKFGFDKISFESLLGQMGEGGDWRKKLQSAIG